MNTSSQIEFAVDMRSPCCAKKVEKVLEGIEGVKLLKVDPVHQRVVVEGLVIAEKLKNTIERETGLSTVILGFGSSSNKNFGAAVAPIALGDSSVRGLLRMTQTDEETCIIEGSLDGLPNSENLYVSLHDTGDLTKGCYSCGPPYSYESDDFAGIIRHLKPESDMSVNFRCSSKLKVADMYGRCMVVHNGNEQQVKDGQSIRLACGVVARSSGMFQNSKRFCACDGVSIWEEKRKIDEQDSL